MVQDVEMRGLINGERPKHHPPIKSMWGDWYLKFPIFGPIILPAPIPSTGVLAIPGIIPGTPPAPYSIPMQALIGVELSNLCVIEVE